MLPDTRQAARLSGMNRKSMLIQQAIQSRHQRAAIRFQLWNRTSFFRRAARMNPAELGRNSMSLQSEGVRKIRERVVWYRSLNYAESHLAGQNSGIYNRVTHSTHQLVICLSESWVSIFYPAFAKLLSPSALFI
jgi:hypothetical protein